MIRRLFVAWALAAAATAPALADAPVRPEGGDASVRPQDDLYLAFNGAWVAATPIPPDKSEVGVWTLLSDRRDDQLRAILDGLAAPPAGAASNPVASGREQQVGAYYRAFVDEAAIDRAGLAPLEADLAEVSRIRTRTDFAAWLGRHLARVDLPVAWYVDPDAKDPGRYTLSSWQSGLGLPDRDYYLKPDARMRDARVAYGRYLETLLRLAGVADAPRRAAEQVAFETALAKVQWERSALRDPLRSYNPTTFAALARRAPGFDWRAFAGAAGLPDGPIIASQPSYLDGYARLVARTPVVTLQTYAQLRLIDAAANVLPAGFREARFAFRDQTLAGLEAPRPRWKKGIGALDGALGEALGAIYVERHFPPEAKARMRALVGRLVEAYGRSIDALPWMTAPTRVQARAKLARIGLKIGYPDRWRDLSGLEVREGDAYGNLARLAEFEWKDRLRRIGGPVDRDEWGMPPQAVNAYYDASRNEIVFPAAILQPPFFDLAADDAPNYGAIGAIIGHELSHAFDDYGSRYDGDGRLRNWWTAADRKAFDALTRRLIGQFDAYAPLPGRHVNGRLTLGENIADLSGLQMAYKAWQLSLEGRTPAVIDGWTGAQRFFIGWSQAWREKMRDAALIAQITSDEHSPSPLRANGAAVNSDGFHDAFGTKPGDRMWKAPAARLRIW